MALGRSAFKRAAVEDMGNTSPIGSKVNEIER
jgi:hypothetical protein